MRRLLKVCNLFTVNFTILIMETQAILTMESKWPRFLFYSLMTIRLAMLDLSISILHWI